LFVVRRQYGRVGWSSSVELAFEVTPDLAIAFVTLFVLEIVQGVDNVIFISILASKLPVEQQARARNLGLTRVWLSSIQLLELW
jgi:predicted tellurium resistance membrane protein TerC